MGSKTKQRVTMHDIHLAIKLRSLGDVEKAMSHDLSLDVNQSLFGATALSLSLYYNCDEAFHLLLDRHQRTSALNLDLLSADPQKRREPALVTAVRLGNEAAVRRLVECGADLEAVDGFGHAALWTAARERRFSIAVTLLSHGATVRPTSRAASLPVFAASRLSSRRTDLTQLLLLAGADDVNTDRASLLERMLAPGRHAVVRLLLAACHVTRHGLNPQLYTTTHRDHVTHDDVIDRLLRHHLTQPAPLQWQCRWTIRRAVSRAAGGRHFLRALSRLPLPKPMRDFVSLVDVVTAESECQSTDADPPAPDWTRIIHSIINPTDASSR